MTQQNDSVPGWFNTFIQDFAKFREDNAKEHGTLAQEIAKAETRTTRWMIGSLITVSGIILGGAYLIARLAAQSS